jgi:histidine ammonia-lyase
VVAASLLNESKVLAHPASVDSLPTSGGQEDHVSMGMTAATKLRAIVGNAEYMVAIELLAAAEALRYRQAFEPGTQIRRVVEVVRSIAPPLEEDRPLARDIEATAAAIRQGRFDEWAVS